MGAGYTRQSSADIADGEVVEAAPLNAEFNAIQSFADGTSGHSHDGTVGEGPKISLLSSVTGVLQAVNGGTGGLNKTDATTAPTVNDDSGDGYAIGSLWIDVTNNIVYICVDATATAAVWVRYQDYSAALASIAGLTTAANKMIYTTASNTYAVTDLTAFARTILDDADGSAVQTTLGVSTYAKTLLDDADASAALSTLGVTAYAKTILDDADAATARTTLGLGTIATLSSVNDSNWSGTDLSVANGGTGASDAATARTNLGLGTMATQAASAVAITGGTIGSAVTGVTQSAGDNSTKLATTAYVDSGVGGITSVPAAAVMPFYRSSAPTGWLKCNGAAVSRTTYATLWAAMGSPNTGDGSTTFTLPDLRAEWVRGLDDGRNVDTGRVLGSTQSQDIQAHTHSVDPPSTTTSSDAHTHTFSGTTSTGGSHTHGIGDGSSVDAPDGGAAVGVISSSGSDQSTTSNGSHSHTYSGTTSSDSHNHTVDIASFTSGSTGGTETRTRNVALLYCIKT